MSKHKTRQQKIIAELHRKLEAQHAAPVTHTTKASAYTYTPHAHISNQAAIAHTIAVPYVQQDLIKTMSVTAIIIVGQLILYYLLKSHMISIPFIQY